MRRACLVTLVLTVAMSDVMAESEAAKHFNEGRQLMAAGKFPEACAAFEASQRTQPKAGTLLNLGDCQEKRGFTATARSTFLQAKVLARQVGDPRREAEIDRRLESIEPLLSKLTVVVAPDRSIDGMSIRRNGAVLDRGSWNSPVALDPGPYTIEVSAPGYQTWSKPIMLGAKEKALIAVEALMPDGRTLATGTARPAVLGDPILTHELGIGASLGLNIQHESALVGVRVIGAMNAPGGQIRGIGSLLFSNYRDEPMNTDWRTSTYSLGVSATYLWIPVPRFAIGGGLGIGADYDVVSPKLASNDPEGLRENDIAPFFSLHLSPIVVRLRRQTVEVGLQVAALIAGDEHTFSAIIGLDWFLW